MRGFASSYPRIYPYTRSEMELTKKSAVDFSATKCFVLKIFFVIFSVGHITTALFFALIKPPVPFDGHHNAHQYLGNEVLILIFTTFSESMVTPIPQCAIMYSLRTT